PADTCGRALERLDRTGVVVALDLEDDSELVVQRHDPRVLQRALFLRLAVGLEEREDGPRVFVAAVLRPHDREHSELGLGRLAAQYLFDLPELQVVETHFPVDVRRDHPRPFSQKQAREKAPELPFPSTIVYPLPRS